MARSGTVLLYMPEYTINIIRRERKGREGGKRERERDITTNNVHKSHLVKK